MFGARAVDSWGGEGYKHGVTALTCTLGAFGLILVLARLKVPLALAVLAGTIAVAALFGLGPWSIVKALAAGAVQPWTIGLVVITVLLLGLSETMRVSGQLEGIVSLARQTLRRPAVSMAALPALIGLLPMPGGALFSAPMVRSAAGESSVAGSRLAAINYWFRHIWEHWWPLYPGVILAMRLTDSAPGTFIAFQLPLGVMMATAGLILFRGSHPDLRARSAPPPPGTRRRLARLTSSIWLIMLVWAGATAVLWVVFGAEPRALPGGPPLTSAQQRLGLAHKFGPITLGLLASLAWTVRLNRLSWRRAGAILANRRIYALVGLVAAVMVFQHVLKAVEVAPRIGGELTELEVPPVLVVALLPFIAGMVTGLAIGFVGTSFPIVLALVAALPGGPATRPYAVLAYGCGHIGMMLSPLHLCNVVTVQYFNTSFRSVYRLLLPAAGALAAAEAAYFAALALAMGR